ncbi:hypothetical protein Fmac_006129 [Flemingia macrophylla]|uniref:Calmodulin-binding protein n=1 Tax=Flemingia macrophylla TaxID=520843 RepID=A0ABD1N9P7_9FABA
MEVQVELPIHSNGAFFFSAPTSPTRHQDFDFDFNFSTHHLHPPSLSAADDLFHAGKIRPLEQPITSTTTPPPQQQQQQQQKQHTRGRQRLSPSPSASRRKGSSRSLSPLRISDIVCDSEDKAGAPPLSSSASNTKSSFFTRKWRIRDFLLFRSASEGDARNSSFRSSSSAAAASASGSVSRRRGPLSAHELHYTLNRAASQELRKKTPLPYKQGLLGCLGLNFNPAMPHHISKGIGFASFTRSYS